MLKKLILILLLSLSLNTPASADSSSNFIANIDIDVTSSSSAAAREKGMAQAYRDAFMTISSRLTNSAGLSRLESLTDSQLINFIKEATVISEKSSDVRYIASLKVYINGDLLKTYMKEQGISFAQRYSSNILIIPIFREFKADSPRLWENNNPWRQAWETSPLTDSTNTYISLPPTATNYSAIDGEQASRLDSIALEKVAASVGTNNIYILDAVYNGIEGLNVTIKAYNRSFNKSLSISGERSPEIFKQAIPSIVSHIDSSLKEDNLNQNSQPKEILILYNYSNLNDWLKAERKIKELTNVNSLETEAIGKGKIQFRLKYVGNLENLSTGLRSKLLTLKNYDNFYILENIYN